MLIDVYCFAIFSFSHFARCVQFLHFGNVCGNFFRCGRKQDKKPPLALFPLFLLVDAVVVRDLSSLTCFLSIAASLAAAVIDIVADGVGVAGLVDVVVLTYLLLASFLSALASFSVVTWPCFCFLYKPLKYSSSDVKDRSDKREVSSTKVALWTFKKPTSMKRKLSRPMIFTPECFNLPQWKMQPPFSLRTVKPLWMPENFVPPPLNSEALFNKMLKLKIDPSRCSFNSSWRRVVFKKKNKNKKTKTHRNKTTNIKQQHNTTQKQQQCNWLHASWYQ